VPAGRRNSRADSPSGREARAPKRLSEPAEPLLDYLAKDYASFRALQLELADLLAGPVSIRPLSPVAEVSEDDVDVARRDVEQYESAVFRDPARDVGGLLDGDVSLLEEL